MDYYCKYFCENDLDIDKHKNTICYLFIAPLTVLVVKVGNGYQISKETASKNAISVSVYLTYQNPNVQQPTFPHRFLILHVFFGKLLAENYSNPNTDIHQMCVYLIQKKIVYMITNSYILQHARKYNFQR